MSDHPISDQKRISFTIIKTETFRITEADYRRVLYQLALGVIEVLNENNKKVVFSAIKSAAFYYLDRCEYTFFIEWEFVKEVTIFTAPPLPTIRDLSFWKRLVYLFTGRHS